MERALVLILLAIAGAFMFQAAPRRVLAMPPNPTVFTLDASQVGWNSTNPRITEFRGVSFNAKIVWENLQHDFAIYTNGFPASGVSTSNGCSLASVSGCLKASRLVSISIQTTNLTFTPMVPPDDFSGVGGYEYFCQIHPLSMHGHLTIYKSPDLDANGVVNILDIAVMAFAFDTTPSSPNWRIQADLDNNGRVDILDISIGAFYFDSPF